MQGHPRHRKPNDKRKAKVIPSSLPPSSPIASDDDDIFVLTSPVIERVDDEYDPATEFDSRHYETTTHALPTFDSNSSESDPFGFFAVEKKLKAERLGHSKLPPTGPRRPLVIRPAQQKISPSVSRTPSPPTRSSPQKKQDETRDSDDDEPPKSSIKGKKAPEPLDPARIAARLTALLPKKPPRDVNHETTSRERASDKETVRVTRNRSKLGVKTRQNEINDEEDEQLGLERQARLEYYRKLDGYSIAKENVYVI